MLMVETLLVRIAQDFVAPIKGGLVAVDGVANGNNEFGGVRVVIVTRTRVTLWKPDEPSLTGPCHKTAATSLANVQETALL